VKRYGALPLIDKVRLTALFLAVQVVTWWFFSSPGVRFAAAVLTAAVILVAVKTRKRPAR
jgi:hypothetical protein